MLLKEGPVEAGPQITSFCSGHFIITLYNLPPAHVRYYLQYVSSHPWKSGKTKITYQGISKTSLYMDSLFHAWKLILSSLEASFSIIIIIEFSRNTALLVVKYLMLLCRAGHPPNARVLHFINICIKGPIKYFPSRKQTVAPMTVMLPASRHLTIALNHPAKLLYPPSPDLSRVWLQAVSVRWPSQVQWPPQHSPGRQVTVWSIWVC